MSSGNYKLSNKWIMVSYDHKIEDKTKYTSRIESRTEELKSTPIINYIEVLEDLDSKNTYVFLEFNPKLICYDWRNIFMLRCMEDEVMDLHTFPSRKKLNDYLEDLTDQKTECPESTDISVDELRVENFSLKKRVSQLEDEIAKSKLQRDIDVQACKNIKGCIELCNRADKGTDKSVNKLKELEDTYKKQKIRIEKLEIEKLEIENESIEELDKQIEILELKNETLIEQLRISEESAKSLKEEISEIKNNYNKELDTRCKQILDDVLLRAKEKSRTIQSK